MATKIIMVVDQQNTLLRPLHLLPETGRGQSADPGTDHHQIKLFRRRYGGKIEGSAVTPQLVRMFKGTGVVAPQSGQRRRIVEGLIGGLRRCPQDLHRRQPGSDGDRHPIKKIASGDTHNWLPFSFYYHQTGGAGLKAALFCG
ncbi:hypothetical protein D3C80_894870 [compost metagenome]